MNRQEIYNQFITINRRFEKSYFAPVKSALIPPGLINAIKAGQAELFLNRTLSNPKLTAIIRKMYVDVGIKHATLSQRRMKSELRGQKAASIGFNEQWTRFILDYLNRFLIDKITYKVTRTTREQLLQTIQRGITEGASIDEMVSRIENLPFLDYQAAMIVRTEVNRAANVGTKAQSSTFPFEQMKEWISAEDLGVRGTNIKDHASHVALDGQKINAEDVWIDPRNGDRLDHPGDPNASAESTIDCRCTVAYTAKRDVNGKPIPRRQSTTVIFPNQRVNRTVITI